jgi:hypothetical protein
MRDFIKEAKGEFNFFRVQGCNYKPLADLDETDPHVITSVGNEGLFLCGNSETLTLAS